MLTNGYDKMDFELNGHIKSGEYYDSMPFVHIKVKTFVRTLTIN